MKYETLLHHIITRQAACAGIETPYVEVATYIEDDGVYLDAFLDNMHKTIAQARREEARRLIAALNTTSRRYADALLLAQRLRPGLFENGGEWRREEVDWQEAVRAGFRIKTWDTKRDDRVRKFHHIRHGEFRGINERFSVQLGDIGPMYPRDPVVLPGDRFNCRCRLKYSL